MLTTQMVAHRGRTRYCLENSLGAVMAAYDLGADAAEFDIRSTADDRWVLMHDASVERTTYGTGYIADMTLDEATGLRLLDGQTVPALWRVMRYLRDNSLPAVIEVKAGSDPALHRLANLLTSYDAADRMVVIFGDPERLAYFRRYASWARTGLVTKVALPACTMPGCKVVAVEHTAITPSWLAEMGNADIAVYAWTVNDLDRADQLRGRVTGIMTDLL